jgi:DNA segregation ATPase FtsK/SpoIIIE-like protein
VARRRASRGRGAQTVGAALIALAVLSAVSLVPHQTAAAPRWIAARLGQGFGAGVVCVPVFLGLLGLIFSVRRRLRLSARLTGVLLGYIVTLIALHLRYPAGEEWTAAVGRKGGGYVGAALEVLLRRALGEPGLWTATLLGAGLALMLISGTSFTDVFRALWQVLAALRAWVVAGLRALGTAAAALILAALRRAAPACRRAIQAGGQAAGTALAHAAERARAALPGHRARAGSPALDPLLASAGGAPVAVRDRFDAETPAVARRLAPYADDVADGEMDRPDDADAAGPAPADDMGDASTGRAGDDASSGDAEEAQPNAAREPMPSRGATGPGPRRRRTAVAQEALPFPEPPPRAYTLPDLSLLDAFQSGKGKTGKVDPEEVARHLERTLASFGVEARVVRWETGPVVTRYELQPAPGVKVQRITSLQNDIALALAASSVRLEAPIPGKSAIGVELPNERASLVHLREVLASDEFRAQRSPLAVAIGKGTAGAPVVTDLVTMPHLLIAGATGAGKSVMLNSMIASILFRSTPEQARFLMIDPKRVELTNYNGIPHLLSPVVTGPREAAAKLRWAIQEMESRYEMFAGDGVRNIQSFNAQHPDRPLAFILIIIDELADLMMVAPADFEEIICRLAQMTRATGIHLLVATQRPSVDVITGLIKANIPSRMAFAVSSLVDSRTILDHPGAEKLLGKGDMLFAPIGAARPLRVQGAFISDAETERLVGFWRAQGEPAYVESLVQAAESTGSDESPGDDALLVDAARLVVRSGYGSVSLLQRKMRIGYVRAARLVDQLEEKGIVGPSQGSSPRDVLMGVDDLERVLREGVARPGAAEGDES